MSKKSTDAEVARRIRFVQRLLLRGRTRSEILQFATKKWDLEESMIDKYIARAKEFINEVNKVEMLDNMAMITRNYWENYREALKEKNRFLAVSILEKIAKLKGLSQDTLKLIIDDGKDLADFQDETLEQALKDEQLQ